MVQPAYERLKTVLTLQLPSVKRLGETSIITTKLTEETGTPIAGEEINFYIQNELVSKAYTDSHGEAKITVTPSKIGELSFKATYLGGERYLGSESETETMTVVE